ncbi:hypothetical protein V9K67_25380 [Paraflavisolibacter sp. H34]|uniref:hypothetical protein n=1 Tax=Huijunlia imazamoxiresistens TaxID=3127457 RepID=UPI00301B31BE
MKKLSAIFSGIFFLLLSLHVSAQAPDKGDYFSGKWNVLVEGTPGGDAKMIVNLERKDGKLGGAILDSTNKEVARFSKVEESEKSVTVYFTSQGFDVYMLLEKKDADHVAGSMMDLFDAKGDRIKEKETKTK